MVIPPVSLADYAQIAMARAIASKIVPYAPVASDTGRETWFEGSGAVVCLDGGTWSQVWDRHIKNEAFGNQRIGNLNPAPTVDFTKNFVVALFSGPTRGVVGYRTVAGYALGREATLRLVPITDPSRTSAVALPSPWAFLVLARTRATVKIELLTGNGWTTVAQIKPTL